MSEFKVYHTRNWALNTKLHFNTDSYSPVKSNYELVALVETDALGETFRLTNHIDDPWWENEGVVKLKESRSTSVGDLVENEDGKLFLCCGVGWTKVEWNKNDDFIVYSDSYGEFLISKKDLIKEVEDDLKEVEDDLKKTEIILEKLKKYEKAIGELLI